MTDEEILGLAKHYGQDYSAMEDEDRSVEFLYQYLYAFARAIAAKQIEIDAEICKQSDRYRGEYFASLIRNQNLTKEN